MKLEKFNYSSGSKKKYFLYGFILAVGLMVVINIFVSHAKYQVTQSIKLAEGKISYKPYDFKIMAMYQENDQGEYIEIKNRMPLSGYVINEDNSYCTIDNENKDTEARLFTNKSGEHVFKNLAYNDKCYIWFDKINAKEQILANMSTKSERTDFSQVMTNDTPGTIYMTEDDDGVSYYYAGAASDNWVKFGKNKDSQDLYWRIIRINGDNTIRLIYEGPSTRANNESSVSTQIGTSAFNSNRDNNMYVGYMYTNGLLHGLGTESTIKGVLDKWYDTNLADEASYIDTNAGFCGDRVPTSGNGIETETKYAAFTRLIANKNPSFKCVDESDLYTMTSSEKGNKKLSKPIGLITADEVAFAGGVFNTNNLGFYLYTGQHYWAISPAYYPYAGVFGVNSSGVLNYYWANEAYGIRPVINLRADTQFKAGTNGTINNPYEVI